MTRISLVLLLSVLALPSVQTVPAHAAETRHRIGEADARRISDAEYEALLETARRGGWTYSADQVESGHRRHFQEFRMRLMNRGYEIVPVGTYI
jgi:hypothetical protein